MAFKRVNLLRLLQDTRFLTELLPYRNYKNLDSLQKVAAYIQHEFEQCGLKTEIQEWEVWGNTYQNIIATYNSGADKRLIVGAHYDVCGDQPGADDNASGIAGLLETARLISENKPLLDYRIDFVAYCLEEPPFFDRKEMGSYVHAHSLAESNANVIGMICYEMIGYFSDVPGSQPFPSPELAAMYPDRANFIMVVGHKKDTEFNHKVYELMANGSGVDVQIIEFDSQHELAGLSDHRSYWKFGYHALMINDTAFIRNPHYHKQTDTIDTLDFEKMAEVVNRVYSAIIQL